jgi:Xaa-Pro aminopeptidase
MLRRRHEEVREALRSRSLDALVVTSLPNILYLTNFTGSSAIVVLTAEHLKFITDFRYLTAIADARGTAHECPGLELVRVEAAYDTTLIEVLSSLAPAKAGFEAANLTVARYNWMREALGEAVAPALVPTEGIVEAARIRKDAYELGVLREAARRLSRVAAAIPADIKIGQSELELARAIDRRIREVGFQKAAFDTIVAAGPNGALPHAHPGERKFVEGDLVVLDFGGVWDSYCVDLTRTVSLGPASAEARRVYNAVLKAHDLAIHAVRPGESRFAIDAAARDSLTGDGLGDVFGHGTGHGLGLEVHEEPRIGRRRPKVDDAATDVAVTAGMVFTIEPGAYLPGWGGVRIEDDVVVTETGVEVLTDVTTELLEI